MRKFAPLLLLIPLIPGCQSAPVTTPQTVATTQRVNADTQPLTGSSATLTVYGMGCPMCSNNVHRQLLRVPGVQSVNVNLGDGSATIAFKPGEHPTREQLAQAVHDSGFTLHELRQP